MLVLLPAPTGTRVISANLLPISYIWLIILINQRSHLPCLLLGIFFKIDSSIYILRKTGVLFQHTAL